MPDSFSILCVCTGNICRSPAAERLLSAALGPGFQVSSAGTVALEGRWVESPMDRLVVLAGGDVSGFAARQLREPMLRQADLILTMTDAHTGDVIDIWPRAARKTFSIGEFARILGSVDVRALTPTTAVDRLRAAIPLVAANRRPVADRTQDDVLDPYRRSDSAFEQAFDHIQTAVGTITRIVLLDRDQERL